MSADFPDSREEILRRAMGRPRRRGKDKKLPRPQKQPTPPQKQPDSVLPTEKDLETIKLFTLEEMARLRFLSNQYEDYQIPENILSDTAFLLNPDPSLSVSLRIPVQYSACFKIIEQEMKELGQHLPAEYILRPAGRCYTEFRHALAKHCGDNSAHKIKFFATITGVYNSDYTPKDKDLATTGAEKIDVLDFFSLLTENSYSHEKYLELVVLFLPGQPLQIYDFRGSEAYLSDMIFYDLCDNAVALGEGEAELFEQMENAEESGFLDSFQKEALRDALTEFECTLARVCYNFLQYMPDSVEATYFSPLFTQIISQGEDAMKYFIEFFNKH